MRVVGLKVLKNRLSEYVRLAADGERILAEDRHPLDDFWRETLASQPAA